MPKYSYEIGTARGSMTNLESLATPVRPPKFSYEPYSKPLPLGNGTIRGGGWPKTKWHWDQLTAAERDQLRTFCSGASAQVYIRTRVNANSTSPAQVDQYKYFSAVMIWPNPEGDREMGGLRMNFEIQFQAMVEVA